VRTSRRLFWGEVLPGSSHIIQGHLPRQVVDRFCEVCATRDLIVHSQGKINRKYMRKAGGLARGEVGGSVVVDEKYFRSSMSSIKDIYEEIYAIMESKYISDDSIAAVLSQISKMETGAG
jgi:hypothetical protein